MRTYSKKQVQEITKKSDSTIYRWEIKGSFPRRIRLSANSVVYDADEVDQWIASKCPRGMAGSPGVRINA